MTSMTRKPPLYSIVISRQESEDAGADRDYREGDLCIDWVDYHSEKDVNNQDLGIARPRDSSGAATLAPNPTKNANTSPRSRNPELEGEPGPRPLSRSPASEHGPGIPYPVQRQTQGTTELGPGVIHLFKHAQPLSLLESLEADMTSSGDKKERDDKAKKGGSGDKVADKADAQADAEGQDGTLIAILAVPIWMDVANLADWLGAWTTCLEGYRMIRDASPNKTLVLLKFREMQEANDFMSIYTGKTFSTDRDRMEQCHPIRIHHLILHTIKDDQKANAPSLPSLLKGIPPKSINELPTCPVCLERMDSVVTGLVTTPCSHVFHCKCLSKWGESDCPACHLSHRTRESESQVPFSKCMLCTEEKNDPKANWVCVVCGYIGCSRYQQGHARDHFLRSGHVYSMEIDTQRVWHYLEDTYVHRLIQNRSDGKLVELPSATSLTTSNRVSGGINFDRLNATALAKGFGPTASDEKKMAQLEDITLEYSYLVSEQLEQQKQLHDAEMRNLTRQLKDAQQKAVEGEQWRKKFILAEDAQKSMESKLLPGLEQAKLQAESKFEKISNLARKLQDDLRTERAMGAGMVDKLKAMEAKLEASRKETQDAKETIVELEDMVKDVTYALEMQEKVKGTEAEGGDIIIKEGPGASSKAKKKKKK